MEDFYEAKINTVRTSSTINVHLQKNAQNLNEKQSKIF